MKINELLNKYFDGDTTCEEERKLRRFFTEEEVPEDLQIYRPLFVCLNQEVKAHHLEQTDTGKKKLIGRKYLFKHRRWLYMVGGAAASIALFIGSLQLFPVSAAPENYVIIDGKRYTDEALIKEKAMEALQNVHLTDEDVNNLLFQF